MACGGGCEVRKLNKNANYQTFNEVDARSTRMFHECKDLGWTLEIYDTCHPVVILRTATLDGRRAKINYVFETGENVWRRTIYHAAGTVNPVFS